MVDAALNYIANEINASYNGEELVIFGNISRLDAATGVGASEMQGKVVLSLVNIEEEKTLKNNPVYVREGEALLKRNPTLFLNLVTG